jgi:transcriptional regulator with XRE-family HTH domain
MKRRRGSGPNYPLEVRRLARELRAEGWTIAEVARELGVSTVSIRNWGLTVAPPEPASIPDWDSWRAKVWSSETIRRVLDGEML